MKRFFRSILHFPSPSRRFNRLGVAFLAEVGGSGAIVWGVWELAEWWAAIVGGLLLIVLAQGIGSE